VASPHEHLRLSEQERLALAELETLITASDPEFSRQLDGKPQGSPRNGRLGLALTALGAMIVLVTFTINLWFAVGGAALMVVGLALALPHALAVGLLARQQRSGPDPR
jgi:hypothetical protein